MKKQNFCFILSVTLILCLIVNATAETLTIAGASSIDQRMSYMEKWLDSYAPGVTVEYIQLDSTALETRLMSKSGHIDLILDNASLVWDYVESGAFLPIDDLPGVVAAMVNTGFVPYQQAMTYDGRIYGIPSAIFFYVSDINESLLASLGLSFPPFPCSWQTLADWAVEHLEGTGYYLCSRVIGADPAGQYVDAMAQRGEAVNLDTEEFRDAMIAWKTLYDHGLINIDGGDQSRSVMQFRYIQTPEDDPLPSVGHLSIQTAEILSFFVNVNTDSLDLVEAWLKEYVSIECQRLGVDNGAPQMMMSSFRTQDITRFDGITLKQRNPYLIGALGYSKIMQQYLDGFISLDEYIREAQAKMDVIQFE